MAPVKRKRHHDEPEPPPPPTAAAAEPTTRRATRQTPILPPPIPTSATASQPHLQPLFPAAVAEEKNPGGYRPSNSRPQPLTRFSETPIPIPKHPSSPTPHPPPLQKPFVQSTSQQPSFPTVPDSRVAARQSHGGAADPPSMAAKEAKENMRPVTLVAPKITYQAPQTQLHRTGSLVRPSPPTGQPPITQHFRPVSTRPYHTIPMTVTAVPVPVPPTSSSPHSKPVQAPVAVAPRTMDKSAALRTDRNIDKVMLGNICFRAWYPSYYGKEVLGDAAGAKGGAGSKNSLSHDLAGGANSNSGGGAKNNQRKGADAPMLDRLYVCPVCFKYSKELVAWWGHVRVCERAGTVPGRKVYIHPRGRRLVRKEIARTTGKKTNAAPKYTEEYVTDEGEWSVREVDGEQDVLFCQNLSLFAKLFLDNKSVFFDVRGFNYFLLVYTPPPKPDSPDPPPRPHIVGFFSKEKMSWDNNNLACILVFPPWQRKGLGALLMGVSYEISRREGVLGGPEKPISELGRRGYKRFWGGEVARWLLDCPTNGRGGGGDADPALLVDVEDCSRATWITLEDCLGTLREMGVVVEAGKGTGKPRAKNKKRKKDGDGEEAEGGEGDEDVEMKDAGPESEPESEPRPDVPRVRVDKAAVWAWVAANEVSLEKVCDPDGFVEGYAIKKPDAEEDSE
ncbi:Males-absent on the first protein [Colletotrichum tanaceti]|uniref:histone acetyltransferase n=1 Tax=Colletotrichum tanaceti TaxID=1306861 RepID=A0A4U6XSU6_9PEZI|nr:Males-absent on the first protein [Colletotrichum tanaceti]TKW58980.1 Males-absent on the first protein [Colletotrichum tanaceti]